MDNPYRRTVDQLEEVASKFWPEELSRQEAELSIIPKLLETQDAFTAILSVPIRDIENIFSIIDESSLPANLFVKHLAVLADFGGEQLQRISHEFKNLFPSGTLIHLWSAHSQVEKRVYTFQALPINQMSNATLGLTGTNLLKHQ